IYNNCPSHSESTPLAEVVVQEVSLTELLKIITFEDERLNLNNDQSAAVINFQKQQQGLATETADAVKKAYVMVETDLAQNYSLAQLSGCLDNIDTVQQLELRDFAENLNRGAFGSITGESLRDYIRNILQSLGVVDLQ